MNIQLDFSGILKDWRKRYLLVSRKELEKVIQNPIGTVFPRKQFRVEETSRWLRVLADLQEDLSPVPSTHIGAGDNSMSCNSSSRGPDTLFWPLWAPIHTEHTLPYIHIN